MPDPPGWAIDYSGPGIFGQQLSEDGNWFAYNSNGAIWLMNVPNGSIRPPRVPADQTTIENSLRFQ
jgi:hypothetical protein